MKLKIVALLGLLAFNVQSQDYSMFKVSGNSMLPMFKNGDVVVIDKAFPYNKLQVNDIVCFNDPEYSEQYSTCHRVVMKTVKGFISKGDNNILCDGNYITSDGYIGKVVKIISR